MSIFVSEWRASGKKGGRIKVDGDGAEEKGGWREAKDGKVKRVQGWRREWEQSWRWELGQDGEGAGRAEGESESDSESEGEGEGNNRWINSK